MSQAANDWCDRHVDAINEPDRPIPSGRIPGRWGLWIALAMTGLSLAVGWFLGPWGFGATVVGVLAAGAPAWPVIIIALLYAIGAHGIMTLNDFKALKGDLQTGVRSLPVTLGPERAALWACRIMVVPQVAVIGLLVFWDRPWHALVIVAVLIGQIAAMRILLRDPKGRAPWYNGIGVSLYVSGMMVSAFAIRTLEVAL
jgi:chlorophyll synthase